MSFWDDEKTELLKQLWTDSYSASQIAYRLGDGCTKNMVISKSHRLNLAGRPKPKKRKPSSGKGRGRHDKAPVSVAAVVNEAPVQPKKPTLPVILKGTAPKHEPNIVPLALPNKALKGPLAILALKAGMCKFGIGDVRHRNFHFCGRDTGDVARPYCSGHHAIVYQPVGNAAARRRVRT